MARTTTRKKLFQHLRQVDGECLALRKAAELLETTCAATDVGPAARPLRSEMLDKLPVPESVVRNVARELRAQARVLERGIARLERQRVQIPDDCDIPADEDDDIQQNAGMPQKFHIIPRETRSSGNTLKGTRVQS